MLNGIKIKEWIKQETVLIIAWILAVISMFFVLPDRQYIEYIDVRTLSILFCLMAVMAGLKNLHFFQMIAEKLLQMAKSERSLETILILLCFFFGMFITNDVALITFVPLALEVLAVAGYKERIVFVVVMQTIAANLGSMATPVGNPQNLYLYTKSQMSVMEFVGLLFPYTLVAFVLIMGTIVLFGKKEAEISFTKKSMYEKNKKTSDTLKQFIYLGMFLVCILAVMRMIPIEIMFVSTMLMVAVMDRKVIGQIDYSLLLTFLGFFLFVGNMGRIEIFQEFLQQILEGNEFLTATLLSQGISNVPAALLLSGFTAQWKELLVGVNLGGLGTLIASMASLISYKFVVKEYPERKRDYFIRFTIYNVAFFVIMVGFHYFIIIF